MNELEDNPIRLFEDQKIRAARDARQEEWYFSRHGSEKVGSIHEEFRKKPGAEYICKFDRRAAKYLRGE